MKRWILPLLIALVLVLLALSVGWWLPPLLAFLGTNSDLIQGLEAGVQLLLWLGVGAVALFGYLRQRPSRQTPARVSTGGGAYVGGDVTAGRDVIGRDQFAIPGVGNVIMAGDFAGRDINLIITQSAQEVVSALKQRQSRSPEALQKAAEEYYRGLLGLYRYLNLHVGIADRVPVRIPLLDLYVPLRARLQLPEGETWRRETRLAGRELSPEEMGSLAGRLGEPLELLGLLQKNPGLIILGDPGAGKTTFLKYLALKLAVGEGDELGFGGRVPLLLPLSAYAKALSGRQVRLDDYFAEYWHAAGVRDDLPLHGMATAALDSGKALFLLDGLDEVKDADLRREVVQRVASFCALRRGAGNKFVVTSRVIGYRDVRPAVEGVVECTLVDFDDGEIAAFVNRWTSALEFQVQGDTGAARFDAARERRELLDAIHRNPSVRRLAANPLLLTILALMKRQGTTLPERRVDLYDKCVQTLLTLWNKDRSLNIERPQTRDLDLDLTTRILASVALWMHEVSPGLGLVGKEELSRQLETVYQGLSESNPARAAAQFLDDVGNYAGLLLERGPGEYGFIHLTFEEYLAAAAIGQEAQGDCRSMLRQMAKHVGDPVWREVNVLTVGYVGITQRLPGVAGALVEELVKEQPGQPGEAVVLAGEAVTDIWPAGVLPRSKDAVVAALRTTMQDAAVPVALRRRAGLALGRLGWLPDDLDQFVAVGAGVFPYGEGESRTIPAPYWIGKYPVTNNQYDRFMTDGGYDRKEFWSEDGWAWRQGADPDLATIDDKAVRDTYNEWLANRPKDKRRQPYWWDSQEESNPILPVVGITWYEAEAYAKWLDCTLDVIRIPDGAAVLRPAGYAVRLATEEEWERAARGADGQEYPWKGSFDYSIANVAEELGRGVGATAVCTFPQGVSPTGAWDMSGNVWEWTLSKWSREPFRVLRGGSWGYDQRSARCASRIRSIPDYFLTNLGFSGGGVPIRSVVLYF